MNFQDNYQFHIPIKFVNGYGSIERLSELVDGFGNNFMLVTGKKAMKTLGYTQKVLSLLKAKGKKVILFDNVEPNPTTDTVDRGADLLKNEKCDIWRLIQYDTCTWSRNLYALFNTKSNS